MSTKTKTTNEGRIRKVIETWADALRNKNANGVLFHYALHPVHFSLAPPLLSTASNSKGWNAWFATWEGPIGYEIRDVTVTIGDDSAFSHSLNRMHGTKMDGTKADLWFRQTFSFRKVDDEWKIAHEHESVPFYMDGSYKAAVDLKP